MTSDNREAEAERQERSSEARPSRTRQPEQADAQASESTYKASELIESAQAITQSEVENNADFGEPVGAPFAAGALRHAEIKSTDMITRAQFLEAIQAFREVEAR